MRWPFRRREEPAAPAPKPLAEPTPAPASIEGWWFAPHGIAPQAGRRDVVPVLPAPGQQGLHAARTVLDALEFARSPHLCRVRLTGEIAERGPLIAATERTILWCLDPTPLLRSILIELTTEVLGDDLPAETQALATRALTPPELASLSATCDVARDTVLDAESRVSDAEWLLERRGGDDAIAEARRVRTSAAVAKARVHALDALRAAAGRAPSDLATSVDLALRGIAWTRAARGDSVTSTALDDAIAGARREWAATIESRVTAIATATGADQPRTTTPAPIPGEPEPERPSRPRVSIEPLRMALPIVTHPPPGPSLPDRLHGLTRSRTSAKVQLEANAAVTRAATIDLDARGQRAIVATLEPFDYAAGVMTDLMALERTGISLVVLLGGRSLESSGPDVWITRSLLTRLEGAPPTLLRDAIGRALARPDLVDRPAVALGRTHGVELDNAAVVVDPFAQTTHRCTACGTRYELSPDVPIEKARCRCGSREIAAIAPRDAPRAEEPVLCMMCGHMFDPGRATRNVWCPACGCLGAPVPYPFRDQIAQLRIGTDAQQADRALERFASRTRGVNRSAWLSRDDLHIVVEAATSVDRDALHLSLQNVHGVSAVVVVQGENPLVPLRATGALRARVEDPAFRAEIADAWRTSTVWALSGLDQSVREGSRVRAFRSRCERCGQVAVVTLPPPRPDVCLRPVHGRGDPRARPARAAHRTGALRMLRVQCAIAPVDESAARRVSLVPSAPAPPLSATPRAMRHLLALASLALVACSGPAPATDAGPDAPPRDAGPVLAEPFAEIGATTEGIAIGRTADGAPVMYVGTLDDRIVRVAPDGVVGDFVEVNDPLGIAVRDDGSLLVCAKLADATPVVLAITSDGAISTLVDADPDGAPFALTNFVAVAPDASIVFSDSAGDRVFRADAEGSNVALVTDAISYPNGLAFSSDGSTLYVASWDGETVHALSFDAGAYGAPTTYLSSVTNVDGIVPTSTGALVLVTSSRGILLADPPADPAALAPIRAITLPANGVFGDSAFGPSDLYVSALGETSIWVVHTELSAP